MTDDSSRNPGLDLGSEREHERERTPSPPLNPVSQVLPNPLSDTTTESIEGPRPVIAIDQHEEAEDGATMQHPFSAEYGPGTVNENTVEATAAPHATTDVKAPEQETPVPVPDGTWSSNTLTLASQTHSQPHAHAHSHTGMDWEDTWERQKQERWQTKVRQDLEGWRGGHGTPRSNYSPTAITTNSYFGSPVTGTIGRDLPKEILRIERDWSGGEVCQFETSFPMELERRISPTQLHELITTINTHLVSAYSTKAAVIDNLIAIATWWVSLWFRPGHFETELRKIEALIQQTNKETFNPVGLNVLSPRSVALQFLEIEYY